MFDSLIEKHVSTLVTMKEGQPKITTLSSEKSSRAKVTFPCHGAGTQRGGSEQPLAYVNSRFVMPSLTISNEKVKYEEKIPWAKKVLLIGLRVTSYSPNNRIQAEIL
jgi:hypothetical protein